MNRIIQCVRSTSSSISTFAEPVASTYSSGEATGNLTFENVFLSTGAIRWRQPGRRRQQQQPPRGALRWDAVRPRRRTSTKPIPCRRQVTRLSPPLGNWSVRAWSLSAGRRTAPMRYYLIWCTTFKRLNFAQDCRTVSEKYV